jgi:hypothetical protein
VLEVDGVSQRVVLIGREQSTDRERTTTMADDLRMALEDLLGKAQLEGDVDCVTAYGY